MRNPRGRANAVDAYVGSRVRTKRTLLGLNQTQLGEALGISSQQLQKYEKGSNGISAGRLHQLSKILDVPVSYFYEDLPDELTGPQTQWSGDVVPDREVGAMQHSLDRRALLAQNLLLRQLSDAELDRLMRYVRVERFDKDRTIFFRGDVGRNMMAVISGRVKLCTTVRSGKEVILNIAGPGDIFGEIAILDELERTADAVTLEETSLLVIEQRDFLPILEDNPKLSLQLFQFVCRRLRRTTVQIGESLYLGRSARLARALLRLASDHGTEMAEGTQIDLKLSQTELGHLVGLTRESINDQLGAWRTGGIVTFSGGRITIHDIEALSAISEVED